MPNDTAPAGAGQDFSAPSGAHTEGRLEFTRGAAHLAIHGASMEDLFRAHFDQPVPSVTVARSAWNTRGSARAAGCGPERTGAGP
jgi:hypothetical protein